MDIYICATRCFHSTMSIFLLMKNMSRHGREKKFYNVYFVVCRYYPFYYAPFPSDFKGLSQFKISFTADKPLRPFDQLMAVLPKERHVKYSLFYNAHSL